MIAEQELNHDNVDCKQALFQSGSQDKFNLNNFMILFMFQ